jgi:hypothetical protein
MHSARPVSVTHPRASVLLLRVWCEPETPHLRRARLLARQGPQLAPVTVGVAAGDEAICELVGQWLRSLEQ